jgi:hypothetical protein
MKRKIINYIALILITLILAGCYKDDYTSFPSNEFFLYHLNDTVIYKSLTNKADTFLITRVSKGYMGPDDGRFYFQIQGLSMRLVVNGLVNEKNDSNLVTILRLVKTNTINLSWGFGIYYRLVPRVNEFDKGLTYADTIYHELQFNNLRYENVYYYSLNETNNRLRKIYYSHNYGLLQYEINNETWSLSEIKPQR